MVKLEDVWVSGQYVVHDCRGVRREGYWYGNGATPFLRRAAGYGQSSSHHSPATSLKQHNNPPSRLPYPPLSTMAQGRREGSAGYSSDQAGDTWTRGRTAFRSPTTNTPSRIRRFSGRFNEPSFEMHLATTCRRAQRALLHHIVAFGENHKS
jgi:hypothetical protein